jgi:amino acid permease
MKTGPKIFSKKSLFILVAVILVIVFLKTILKIIFTSLIVFVFVALIAMASFLLIRHKIRKKINAVKQIRRVR